MCNLFYSDSRADFKLINDTKLPDQFTFPNGTQVLNEDDWNYRRHQIRELVQRYKLGYLPPKPDDLTANITISNITYGLANKECRHRHRFGGRTTHRPASGSSSELAGNLGL